MSQIDVTAQQEPVPPFLLLMIVAVVGAFVFWPREQPGPVAQGSDAIVLVNSSGLANSLLLDELCDKQEVELRRFDSNASMENVEPEIVALFELGSEKPPAIAARINGSVVVEALSGDPLAQIEGLLHGI